MPKTAVSGQKMRILHVYKTYFPTTTGGCEQVIKTLTSHTSQMGYHNKLLTLAPSPGVRRTHTLDVTYLPIHFEMSSCPINLSLLLQFKRYTQDADILHFHFPWPYADLLYLLLSSKKPAVVTYHSDIVRQRFLKPLYTPIMKSFLARVNTIVMTSDNYLASSKDIQPHVHKCAVVPLGLDEADYPPPRLEVLAKWQHQVGTNFMLFIGVLRNYKGIDYLLSAVENTDIPVVLIGTGAEETRLKERSKHMKNITFVGKVSEEDKIALIKLCRGVILPSHLRSEAFGVCLLEGLIHSKPLISTELHTGTSFVNQHNITGFVVPPGNAQALKQAITTLSENPHLAQQMGENGRKHYLTYFKAEDMAKGYISVYQKLLDD